MSEWREFKLGDVVQLNYGKGLPERIRKPGTVPVFSSAGLTGWHDVPLVNCEGIIVGRKGTIGTVYYINKPFFCIDTAYYIEPDKSKYDIKYLYYLLITMGLSELNEDSAVPGLNRDTAYSQDITLPPLPEQRAIAGVLSSFDNKIDLLHRQNKTLEGMAEALWRKMFVDGMDAGWEILKLGDIANVQNCFAFKSSEYVSFAEGYLEVLKMGHIQPGGGLRTAPKTDFVPREDRLTKYILSKGDIVMAMTDMKDNVVILGNPAMIDIDDKYVLNQRVARIYLKANDKLIDSHLLYVQLKDPEFIAILQSKANSGVQVNLSTESIKDCDILIPPIDVQREKGATIIKAYLKQENNNYQIRTLSRLRDTLLPKLMSGEVRVKM